MLMVGNREVDTSFYQLALAWPRSLLHNPVRYGAPKD